MTSTVDNVIGGHPVAGEAAASAIRTKEAAIVVQTWYRDRVARKRCVEAEQMLASVRVAAAVKVQAVLRGIAARHTIRVTVAAVKVQAALRGITARRAIRVTAAAAVTVQAAVRGIAARRAIRATAVAIVTVQAYTRGRHVRNNLSRRRAAAVKVQAAVRAVAASARASRMREEHRRQLATAVMQKAWRGAITRTR